MAEPTHILYATKKGTKSRRRIGAGWMDDKGRTSIILDPCTLLTDREDVYLNLYPLDEGKETGDAVS